MPKNRTERKSEWKEQNGWISDNDRLKEMSYTGKEVPHRPMDGKAAESPQRLEYTLSVPKPTKLDTYKQQADQWLEEALYLEIRILEKPWKEGFYGGYSIFRRLSSGGKTDFALVALRSCRLKPSMALVV